MASGAEGGRRKHLIKGGAVKEFLSDNLNTIGYIERDLLSDSVKDLIV